MKVEINFTKGALTALPLPQAGKRAFYKDSKTRSLMFCITAKDTRSYIFYRKVEGKPERILLGRFDELTVEQARDRAAEFNHLIAIGINPADKRRVERQEMTFRDLFKAYYQRHALVNTKGHADAKSQFERYCASDNAGRNLADRRVSRITTSDIASLHSKISVSHPIGANRVLALISSVFGWGQRVGLLEHKNPAAGIARNRERARDRFLHAGELPRFFDAVTQEENANVRDYVLLSLLTGARQDNVLSMKWSDVDFEQGVLHIEETKNGSPHVVPLVAEALEILVCRKDSAEPFAEFVFASPGVRQYMSVPHKGWTRILARAEAIGLLDAIERKSGSRPMLDVQGQHVWAGLREARLIALNLEIDPRPCQLHDLRLHDLRRTLGSWQATTGANLSVIGKTLGHKHVATTAIYARLQLDPVRRAIEVASKAMFAAGHIVSDAEVIEIQR